MRLIDADTYAKRLSELAKNAENNAMPMTAAQFKWTADDMKKNAPTIDEWISVKDRLPKSKPDDLEYPTVIIALPDGSVELGCYYESTHEWGAGEWFDEPRKPIAWMPLPEPPEVIQDD